MSRPPQIPPLSARRLGVITLVGALALTAVIAGSSQASRQLHTPVTRQITVDVRQPAYGASAVDAALFAPGACIALPALRGDNHHTVFLDAGHGGRDPGSIGVTESGRTIEEARETLPVELDAARILREHGYRVVVSRTASGTGAVARLTSADIDGQELSSAGVHADVAARALCANHAHAQALIGIYFDAGNADNAGSVTGYDADRRFSAANRRLASLVQRDTLAAMNAQGWQIPSEGVQLDGGLGSAIGSAAAAYGHLLELGPAKAGYFSTPSEMPGAVIEPLFITDPFEGSIADSRHGQQVIASGIATAVEQYFSSGR